MARVAVSGTIGLEITDMFAALIFVVSAVMLAQFVVFFWRANMIATAAQPISEAFSSAQVTLGQAANLEDFDAVSAMSKLCPGANAAAVSLWPVRIYYHAVHMLSRISSIARAQGSSWARQEMAFCSRYVAVSIDQRLLANQAYLTALRP